VYIYIYIHIPVLLQDNCGYLSTQIYVANTLNCLVLIVTYVIISVTDTFIFTCIIQFDIFFV